MLEKQLGAPVRNDSWGVTVLPDGDKSSFARMGDASVILGINPAPLADLFSTAQAEALTLSADERLSFDLYTASFWLSNADSRLLMLMMALEQLLPESPRGTDVREFLDGAISSLGDLDLADNERDSLIGGLQRLKLKSISATGRELVRKHAKVTYDEQDSVAFFNRCYATRSKLVHGASPRPDRQLVDRLAANLEQMVADIIAHKAFKDR